MSDLHSRELFLQQHLMRRAPELREYVAQRIPPSLAANILADDVLQEAWIAAFRGMGGLRIEDSALVERWIISVVNRKLLDALRLAHAKKRGGGRVFRPDCSNYLLHTRGRPAGRCRRKRRRVRCGWHLRV